MDIALSSDEIACVKAMAERFREGKVECGDEPDETLGLTPKNYFQVLSMMERLGVITDVRHIEEVPFMSFTISVRAVEIARSIEAAEKKLQEGKDIVEMVKLTMKRHPVAAWVFIIFSVALFLLTAANQVLGFVKALREL